MNYDKSRYVTGKLVQFFPNDTYRKEGYIRDVDDLGFTYEVTGAFRESDKGIFFINHSHSFVFKELEQ